MTKLSKGAQAAHYYRDHDCTLAVAAAKFGISRQRVQQKLIDLKIPTRHRPTIAERVMALPPTLRAQNVRQIATQLHHSPRLIAAALSNAGILYRTDKSDDLDMSNRMIQEARKGQKTIIELAQMFGMAYITVRKHLRLAGIKTPHLGGAGGRGTGEQGSALVDAEGLSIGAAALRVGCAPHTIRAYRVVRGLPVTIKMIAKARS